MTYYIDLKKGKYDYRVFSDYMLDGIIPERTLELMEARNVDEKIGLCALCDVHGVRCHVMVKIPDEDTPYGESYKKLCPVLFHDVIKPKWKVSQVLG